MVNKELVTVDDDFLSLTLDDSFLAKNGIAFEGEKIEGSDVELDIFVEACNFLLKNKPEIEKVIISKAAKYYSDRVLTKKERYESVFKISLKELSDPTDIQYMISLTKIYVDVEDTCAQSLGFVFHCDWDSEHGFGAKLSSLNECEVGGADIAFT